MPDDQIAFVNKSDCDKRSYDGFEFYRNNER